MRKIQDHYFHKAKKENYPARSVYKLEEANAKYRFLKPGKKRVLDLGCHPGSWSLYCSRTLGERGVVVGIDVLEGQLHGGADGAELIRIHGDVHDDGLITELRRRFNGFHVILSDMAPQTTGNRFSDHQLSLRLMRRALDYVDQLLHPNGSFYCKGFQGIDFPEVVEECRARFKTVKVVKPESSRQESREVFILGLGFGGQGKPCGTKTP